MKTLKAILTTFLVTLSLAQNVSDFAGTFRDQDGDIHTFEVLPDGSLLGHLTVGTGITEVPFTLENDLVYGGLQMDDGSVYAVILRPEGANLNVQLVPISADNVPLIEQAQNYIFVRENLLTESAENPLTQSNPLTTLEGTPIETNQSYPAGTQLISQSAGFSLIVPDGHVATYTVTETGQAGLVVSDQQNNGFIVLGFSKANLIDLAESSLSNFGDIELTPMGTPQQTSDMFRATFQGIANDTPLAVHLAAKQGPIGNSVIMIGFAALGQDAALSQALDNTLNSLAFSQPINASLSLGGLELFADDGSSSSNSSSDAHLTGIKNESYVFCSDSSYGYSMEDTTLFSGGDFGDFSSEDSDQHQGSYEVSSGILGETYLHLKASDGRSFIHPVFQDVNGLMVGGSSFSINQSTQCQ